MTAPLTPQGGEYVQRVEYERMRSVADEVHKKHMSALGENERLRAAIAAEVAEIRGSHYPDADAYGRLCRTCGASDGGWPCVARMAADDLEAALSDRTGGSDA